MILVKSSHVSGSYPVSGLGIGSGLLCGGKKVTFGERKDLLRLPSAAGGRSGDSASGPPFATVWRAGRAPAWVASASGWRAGGYPVCF